MSKMKIIILAMAGFASFAGAFGLTLVLRKSPAEVSAKEIEKDISEPAGSQAPKPANTAASTEDAVTLERGMSQEKLKSYIYDMREKTREYKTKDRELAEQEQRIKIAQQSLQEDIDRLQKVKTEVSLVLSDLKQQEDILKKNRVVVEAEEKANMQRIGATYSTMDVTQSSKIIISMAKGQQLNDAVKILYYMSERTAGKLIGEIASSEPALASVLSLELKKIKESE